MTCSKASSFTLSAGEILTVSLVDVVGPEYLGGDRGGRGGGSRGTQVLC